MQAFAKILILAVALASSGCGHDEPLLEPVAAEDAGKDVAPQLDATADRSAPVPRVFPAYLSSLDAPLSLIDDGDQVPLAWAPQGGYFMFFTAQFGPHDGSDVELSSQLVDPDTHEVIRKDARTGPVLPVPGQPGIYEPDPDVRAAVSHLAACPDSEVQVLGRTLRLELRVSGGSFDESATRSVVPGCMGATPGEQTLCQCYCSPTYEPGSC